jgi:hypothetical protein
MSALVFTMGFHLQLSGFDSSVSKSLMFFYCFFITDVSGLFNVVTLSYKSAS